jgi:hypothetical protein
VSDRPASESLRTANTLRNRIGVSRATEWFLLSGNRFAATGLLAAVVFCSVILLSTVLVPSLQSALQSADTVETMFSTMISVVVTGTTLVVTISQLVISQENGPLGDQRQRMSDAMDFRTYATELFQEAPSASPAGFLDQLLDTTERRADRLATVVEESDDPELRRQVSEFLDSAGENAATVRDELDDADFGTFDVLSAALDYNYAWKIYQVHRITESFEESIDAEMAEAFHQLETALTMFGPAREQIKTLYFQWELIDLSRYILYAAVPALIVAGSMLTFVGGETFPGATVGVPNVTWVVAGAFTVTLAPFLLFLTYILRIVVVAKHTLAIGPFVLRQSYAGE